MDDWRNAWEKAIDVQRGTVRQIEDVFEKVLPKLQLPGENRAQALRRMLLTGQFKLQDLKVLVGFGRKNIELLTMFLGIVPRSDKVGFDEEPVA